MSNITYGIVYIRDVPMPLAISLLNRERFTFLCVFYCTTVIVYTLFFGTSHSQIGDVGVRSFLFYHGLCISTFLVFPMVILELLGFGVVPGHHN